MEKEKRKNKKHKIVEGFSMMDCLSQEVIDKMYNLSKKNNGKNKKTNKK